MGYCLFMIKVSFKSTFFMRKGGLNPFCPSQQKNNSRHSCCRAGWAVASFLSSRSPLLRLGALPQHLWSLDQRILPFPDMFPACLALRHIGFVHWKLVTTTKSFSETNGLLAETALLQLRMIHLRKHWFSFFLRPERISYLAKHHKWRAFLHYGRIHKVTL